LQTAFYGSFRVSQNKKSRGDWFFLSTHWQQQPVDLKKNDERSMIRRPDFYITCFFPCFIGKRTLDELRLGLTGRLTGQNGYSARSREEGIRVWF